MPSASRYSKRKAHQKSADKERDTLLTKCACGHDSCPVLITLHSLEKSERTIAATLSNIPLITTGVYADRAERRSTDSQAICEQYESSCPIGYVLTEAERIAKQGMHIIPGLSIFKE